MTDEKQPPEGPIASDLVDEDASFSDIVMDFVNGLDKRLARMDQALNSSDFEDLRIAAHQLKGSGGGYGYPILTERAAELERHAKTSALDDCIKGLDELRQLCARVVVTTDGIPGSAGA